MRPLQPPHLSMQNTELKNLMKKLICAIFMTAGCAMAADDPGRKYYENYQRLTALGFDVSEMHDNPEIMEKIRVNQDKIKEILGDSYAGEWIGYDKEGRIYHVYAVTDLSVKDHVHVDYRVEFVLVERNEKQLENVKNKIIDSYDLKDRFINTIHIDPIINKVVVGRNIEDHEKVISFLEKLKIDMNYIEIKTRDGIITLY